MATKNSFKTTANGPHATVWNAETINYKVSAKTRGRTSHPVGSIGADLLRRNYVRYLVERYNLFKQAEASFGKTSVRFSYAVLFKNIEARFKAPTYFIPVERFEELIDYLQGRIDQTILGKRNAARGVRNYSTFDEYRVETEADRLLPSPEPAAVHEKPSSKYGK